MSESKLYAKHSFLHPDTKKRIKRGDVLTAKDAESAPAKFVTKAPPKKKKMSKAEGAK